MLGDREMSPTGYIQAKAGQSFAYEFHAPTLSPHPPLTGLSPSQDPRGWPLVLATVGMGWGEKPGLPPISPVIVFLTWQVATVHVWVSMQPLLLHGQSL